MSAPAHISRRAFLETAGAVGAGLVIGFELPTTDRGASAVARAPGPFAPNAWVRLGADDTVLIVVDRSPMRQGVTTPLPMLLPEGLDAHPPMLPTAPPPPPTPR